MYLFCLLFDFHEQGKVEAAALVFQIFSPASVMFVIQTSSYMKDSSSRDYVWFTVFEKIVHYERKQLTLLNSANLETVWRTKCSGQYYYVSLFGKSICKSLGMGGDLHLVSSWLQKTDSLKIDATF